jgi:hypothetical protein
MQRSKRVSRQSKRLEWGESGCVIIVVFFNPSLGFCVSNRFKIFREDSATLSTNESSGTQIIWIFTTCCRNMLRRGVSVLRPFGPSGFRRLSILCVKKNESSVLFARACPFRISKSCGSFLPEIYNYIQHCIIIISSP